MSIWGVSLLLVLAKILHSCLAVAEDVAEITGLSLAEVLEIKKEMQADALKLGN